MEGSLVVGQDMDLNFQKLRDWEFGFWQERDVDRGVDENGRGETGGDESHWGEGCKGV